MSKFKIFVDAIANLTDDMIEKYDIGVIPYFIEIGGKTILSYEEGKDYNEIARQFYIDMEKGACPKSSLVTCERIVAAVEPYLAEQDVLFFAVSQLVSGTYQQAVMAANALNNMYKNKMYVINSANASLGEGLQAVKAGRLREKGMDIEIIVDIIERTKWNINSVFTSSDLKYFRRTGRISTTTMIAGNLLGIKPILICDADGKIGQAGSVRGRKKSITKIGEMFGELVIDPENQTICICHCDCEQDALQLKAICESYGAKDIVLQMYDICSGTHIGPGGLALFFEGKSRQELYGTQQIPV